MFTRTTNKPITLILKHKYSKSHSTVKNRIAHELVSFTAVKRGYDIFLPTPAVTPLGFFLRLIKVWYLRASNFSGCLWNTLVSLCKLEAWQKVYELEKQLFSSESKTEMSRNKSRHCTAVQNSAIVFGCRL